MVNAQANLDYKVPVTELERYTFCQGESELRTKTLREEFERGVRWQKIPDYYLNLDPVEIDDTIRSLKSALGSDLLILGHHYQRDDVIKHADFRGDSYLLSRRAADEADTPYIIFCGVMFMAETADILTSAEQKVILPNMMAGCSMADMASIGQVEDAWEHLTSYAAAAGEIVPVTYMNSAASIKALCGANNGLVCTSSNAKNAFKWAFERGEKVFFLPDQHLGRNVAHSLGIDMSEVVVWNPFRPDGGITEAVYNSAKVILWRGHCSVHTRFTVPQIEQARERYPDVNVIVHPECTKAVVDASDDYGSTERIQAVIQAAPDGSTWAIGTEINMVKRLAAEHPTKRIFCLDDKICPCSTMYRTHPAYLLWMLECLSSDIVQNQVKVDAETRQNSLLALERMLQIGGK